MTSIIEIDSGTDGDEQPAPLYELRARTKKQCRPSSCMHSGANTSDDEDDAGGQQTFRHGGRGRGG